MAAILHLTNIRFSQDDETDGVYIDDEYPLEVGKDLKKKKKLFIIFYSHFLILVASLLSIDQEILATALISTYSITRGMLYIYFLKNI